MCAPVLKNKSMDFGFYNKVYDSLKNKSYLSEIFSIQYSELWNREIKANERINTLNDSIKQKIEQVTKLQEYIRNREQRVASLLEKVNKKELQIDKLKKENNAMSYRLCRVITWPARKVYSLIRSVSR